MEPTLADIASQVAAIADKQAEQTQQIADLSKPKSGSPTPGQVFGAPSIRTGEDALSSRGYSFLRTLGMASRTIDSTKCKTEADVHNRLQKLFCEQNGYQKAEANSMLVPFATEHMTAFADEPVVREFREMIRAGVSGCDWGEVHALREKYWGVNKALSWLDESSGGSLVAPPVMGELIHLLRNNEVLMQAGARNIAMPPSGRMVWPRQTSAMNAYWVGQSQAITESEPGTGDVTIQAKKLAILAKVPNELFRFPSVSFEQFLREDMMRVMALKLDKSALEATGSGVEPKGLINYAGITQHTASTTAANGDTLEPEDIALMIGKVEEQNAEFKAWVMRPLMYSALANRRAGSGFADNDGKGNWLFNMLRNVTDFQNRGRGVGSLEGYKAIKSTNVSNTRAKGASSNLSYILGGDFSDVILATSAVIEFIVAKEGDTMVVNDQTWIRGTHYVDVAVAREASLVLCDQLVVG